MMTRNKPFQYEEANVDLQPFSEAFPPATTSHAQDAHPENGNTTVVEYQARSAVRICVHDVAEYILQKLGPLSTMKLQKLVYYCQAWSLVWDEKPLFSEDVEAWANGPVVRELFDYHRGRFVLEHDALGRPHLLTPEQQETIEAVLETYGDKSAQWLIELSHSEQPWQEARRGLPEGARSTKVIPLSQMAEYYSSLLCSE